MEKQSKLRDLAKRKGAEATSSLHEETVHLMRANSALSHKPYAIQRKVPATRDFERILNTAPADSKANYLAQIDFMRHLPESRGALMKHDLQLLRSEMREQHASMINSSNWQTVHSRRPSAVASKNGQQRPRAPIARNQQPDGPTGDPWHREPLASRSTADIEWENDAGQHQCACSTVT